MPTLNGLVLYYNASTPQEAAKAKLVFIRMGLRIRIVAPDQLGQAVGSFAGLAVEPSAPQADRPPIPDSIMVFSGLRGHTLDRVLQALLQVGVPRSVFKAVVTPGNAGWDFYQLYEELKKERAALEER